MMLAWDGFCQPGKMMHSFLSIMMLGIDDMPITALMTVGMVMIAILVVLCIIVMITCCMEMLLGARDIWSSFFIQVEGY
jgi:hypothetical protein